MKHQIQKRDSFTFYVTGTYEMDQHFIDAFEPQFEIGENVIIHIGKAHEGPKGLGEDNYFVKGSQIWKIQSCWRQGIQCKTSKWKIPRKGI